MAGLVTFSEAMPSVYLLTQVYDPAIHISPADSGVYIPAVGSIVVDMTASAGSAKAIYTVESVDPITFASTLVAATSILDLGVTVDRLVSYNNNNYILYYDDRVTPHQLRIDSNILIFGNKSTQYTLYKHNLDGTKTAISIYIDNTGTVQGNIVPIVETAPGSGVRHPIDCYTSEPITDNDIIYIEVYDAADNITMEIKLVSKKTSFLSSLVSNDNVVVDYTINANQQDANGFILFSGQNKNDLAIYPKLTFSDGSTLDTPIDNAASFMYNYDAIDTSLVGMEYDILFKHFLNPNLISALATGDGVSVSAIKKVRIAGITGGRGSKVALIIYHNGTSYQTRFIMYYEDRNNITDETANVTFVAGSFDGTSTSYGIQQAFTISIPLVDSAGVNYTHTQDFLITTYNPTNIPQFISRDPLVSTLIFNQRDTNHETPRLYYDAINNIYGISNALFPLNTKFIENFYTNAAPPFTGTESIAPVPTHFIVRDMNTMVALTATPVTITTYDIPFTLTEGVAGQHLNGTVIVEFMTNVSGPYQLLFGVPVKVVAL